MPPTATIESAFLADICEHPDDDGLRLIYADWLEEYGQPERAEFIRVQVELSRLPRKPCEHHDNCQPPFGSALCSRCEWILLHSKRAEALRRRERELLESNWWRPFSQEKVFRSTNFDPIICDNLNEGKTPMDVGVHFTFRRGFIEEIRLPLASFLAHGRDLVRAAPLRVVRLSDREPFTGYDKLFSWWDRAVRTVHPESDLPHEIFAAVLQTSERFQGGNLIGVCLFSTEQLALDCLSAACLAWARGGDVARGIA